MIKETHVIPSNLFMVIAHPDDETFLGVGLLMANAKAGGQNVVYCATAGEKGMSHLKKPVSPAKLKQMRQQELRTVLRSIPRTKLIIGDCHDGGVKNETQKLWREVVKAGKLAKPELIIGFGPDGITGHTDHIAVSAAATKLAKKMNVPMMVFTYPLMYHKTMPKWLMGRRVNPFYKKICIYQKPKLQISVDPKWKLKMLRIHKSQMDAGNPYRSFPAKVGKHLLANEYFG